LLEAQVWVRSLLERKAPRLELAELVSTHLIEKLRNVIFAEEPVRLELF